MGATMPRRRPTRRTNATTPRVRSVRALARLLGVAHGTVQKAEQRGRIEREPDGTWDVARVRRAWVANATTHPPKVAPAILAEAEAGVRRVLVEAGESVRDGAITGTQAKRAHEILKARRAELEVGRLRGLFVERVKARDTLARFFHEVRDGFLNWPARVAPLLAAELQVDATALHLALEKLLRTELDELASRPLPAALRAEEPAA